MKQRLHNVLFLLIILCSASIAILNFQQEKAIDRSKLPQKVERSKGFQKWITNLKNKDFEIEADEFRLKEENEVFNSTRMEIYSIDEEGREEELNKKLLENKDLDNVVFSPSERQFIDYRYETRGVLKNEPIQPNDAYFYGLRDDKILNSRILTCNAKLNCIFDRAYFLDNNVFVISEFSRNEELEDEEMPKKCGTLDKCTYTIKINVIDLINNSNLIYESKPFELVLAEAIADF